MKQLVCYGTEITRWQHRSLQPFQNQINLAQLKLKSSQSQCDYVTRWAIHTHYASNKCISTWINIEIYKGIVGPLRSRLVESQLHCSSRLPKHSYRNRLWTEPTRIDKQKWAITLLRVIPTMTCWVEVVRWGLSLRIWWEEWRIWEHWFQVSLA